MDDFKVNVVVDAGIGTLHWQGTVDQKTLDEAVSLAADDALIGHELHRVEASITADDLMAMRALHRAGFRREGRRRQATTAVGTTPCCTPDSLTTRSTVPVGSPR